MELELQRLVASGGSSAPMWTKVPEFAGMTRATQTYALGSRISAGQKK